MMVEVETKLTPWIVRHEYVIKYWRMIPPRSRRDDYVPALFGYWRNYEPMELV